ncbi:diglucosylglycerate octanoyltransferase [Nocardia asteroides]|uniref:diglucosylglycerate octanoyltransferase n=1 Tax=Nocardia asteroides TaxID=1824 RepID=UPI001E431183|nr:diglucosylglycerate octanoyltransferase [Nocardia asteroides]UGT54131.1 SGNH/GDSL hydrolase family protein [Nocardia asteroides]
MSSEEPVRSVPDELFQQVTAKAGRQLPDALFGPPPARPARPEREEPIRSVPDELFKQVTARSERSLPDALFGPAPAPVVADTGTAEPTATDAASGEAGGSGDDGDAESEGDRGAEPSAEATGQHSDAAAGASSAVTQPDTVAVTEDSTADADSALSAEPGAADEVAAEAEQDEPTATSGNDPVESADGRTSAFAEVVESGEPDSASGSAASDSDTVSARTESTVAETNTSGVASSAALPTVDAAAPEADASATAGQDTEAGSPVVNTAAADPASPADPAAAGVALVEAAEAPSPVSSASPRPVLLVIADSLAYYGPKGGLPADDPRIWPNMVAAELDWDVELIARIGWTCRDAYWALIGDPRVWAAVPRAGAVVFAVGGMDTLPSPLPTALRELIRYIRPPKLRRGVRASYNWLQPKLSKLGRPVALPPRVSVDYLEQSREALNHLRPELPVVAVLPSVHKCDAYGRVHRGRARAVKALQAWSGRTSVPLVDLGEAVRDDIESGAANPDGIHWGWAGHAAVATAMTKALQEVR